jgi:DNA (cytosine-5)-methyltransferase 1
MTRPRLLDLFCGAGGAGMGYHRAGFDVVGVDIASQKNYPFEFIQGDALAYCAEHGHEFDAIHASPPCQAHSAMKTMYNAREHLDLVPQTREALRATGKPYVIENVPGAPLITPFILCGTMFDLGWEDAELRRHRLFESSTFMLTPSCAHGRRRSTVGVYGGHLRNRRRRLFGVYGDGVRDSVRKNDCGVADFSVEEAEWRWGLTG